MKIAFELSPRSGGAASEGDPARLIAAALDDRSAGSGLARAVMLGVVCWAVVLGVLWMWMG